MSVSLILDDPARSASAFAARRANVTALVAEANVDALLVTHMPNVAYLTGFTGTSGMAVATAEEIHFLTDFRYVEQARGQMPGRPIHEYKEAAAGVAKLLKKLDARKVGFEGDHVSVTRAEQWKKEIDGVSWVPLIGMVERLRLVKDAPEMDAIRFLTGTLARVYPTAKALLKPGAVERDVAVELEYHLMKEGAEGRAFAFIVASGPRGAMPHGVASNKVIQKGELVILDWGAFGRGYHTDNTRTLKVGPAEIPQEMLDVYDVVLEANLAAIESVRPGVTAKEIDAAARGVIERAGFGSAFGHGTGHGVGRDIHEKPTVSWRDETVVEEGMVFTIEPGIYLPGKGGVRIEDMVHVTQHGCEVLTDRIPK
jgi:Xaa-Pro aminopeptidase/Xaa-Pro dipeptidase